jgi:hypothetical protein
LRNSTLSWKPKYSNINYNGRKALNKKVLCERNIETYTIMEEMALNKKVLCERNIETYTIMEEMALNVCDRNFKMICNQRYLLPFASRTTSRYRNSQNLFLNWFAKGLWFCTKRNNIWWDNRGRRWQCVLRAASISVLLK